MIYMHLLLPALVFSIPSQGIVKYVLHDRYLILARAISQARTLHYKDALGNSKSCIECGNEASLPRSRPSPLEIVLLRWSKSLHCSHVFSRIPPLAFIFFIFFIIVEHTRSG